jgi:hypothetical protein
MHPRMILLVILFDQDGLAIPDSQLHPTLSRLTRRMSRSSSFRVRPADLIRERFWSPQDERLSDVFGYMPFNF